MNFNGSINTEDTYFELNSSCNCLNYDLKDYRITMILKNWIKKIVAKIKFNKAKEIIFF